MKNFWKVLGLTAVMGVSSLLSTNVSNAAVLDMDGHWGKSTVEQAIQDGWVEDTKTFNPSQPISRIDAAMYLGKAIDEPNQSNFKPKFTDVNMASEQYPYLVNLTNKGVFADVEKFNPNNTLTRGQAAKIIVEAFDLKGTSQKSFKDVPKNAWFAPYVNTLIANEVTVGKSNELFGPNDTVTKVQFVAFVDRALKITGKNKVNLDEIETSPELFQAIMKKNGKLEEQTMKMTVKSKDDFFNAAETAYTELPKYIQIETNMKLKELQDLLHEWKQKTYPKNNINNMTLANYRVEKRGANIFLTDSTHKQYNAVDIENGVKEFAQLFSERSAAETDREKLLEAYEYVYNNYSYSASGVQSMLIGNMGLDTLACNGFSRLMYELTTAMGLDAEVIRGHEHLWNRVIVDGKEMNVDLSTDIYLNKKYLTLGMSTQEHIEAGGLVNIYNTTFDNSVYYDITESHKNFIMEGIK